MTRHAVQLVARRRRSSLAAAVLGLAAVLWVGPPASGRHNFSMLKVTPELAVAGGEVGVSGFSYPTGTKVAIRFGALDGPVLAELDPTANQDIGGTVRVPAGTTPGRYVLYAVQADAGGKPNRIPGRGALTVAGGGGPPPAVATGLEQEPRPASLVRSRGPGPGRLAVVALVSFALSGLLGAGVVRLLTPRREGSA